MWLSYVIYDKIKIGHNILFRISDLKDSKLLAQHIYPRCFDKSWNAKNLLAMNYDLYQFF